MINVDIKINRFARYRIEEQQTSWDICSNTIAMYSIAYILNRIYASTSISVNNWDDVKGSTVRGNEAKYSGSEDSLEEMTINFTCFMTISAPGNLFGVRLFSTISFLISSTLFSNRQSRNFSIISAAFSTTCPWPRMNRMNFRSPITSGYGAHRRILSFRRNLICRKNKIKGLSECIYVYSECYAHLGEDLDLLVSPSRYTFQRHVSLNL